MNAVGRRRCKMNHRFNESRSKINFVFGRFKSSFVENRETILVFLLFNRDSFLRFRYCFFFFF